MDLTNTTEGALEKSTASLSAKDVILLAVWLGVPTGLVEGGLLLILQKLRWLPWSMQEWSVSLEIVWISSVFDLLLFVVVGLMLVGLGRILPRLVSLRGCLFFFVWLTCFDWLAISGRIHSYAALILAAGLASGAMRWFSLHEAYAMRFARRNLLWVFAATLLALVGIQGGLRLKERVATALLPAISPSSPNILVIVVDTLRADHISTYGYARATSPNLDRIAEQGVLFENAFASSSWSLPSHASLLTGRFQYEHKDSREFYDGRFPNIAQALSSHGYRTGAFSANTLYICHAFGFDLGFLHFEDYFSSWADMGARTLFGRKFVYYFLYRLGYKDIPGRKRAEEVNREFFRWVDDGSGKPFFAFLNYLDVHDPYLPPEPYRSRFADLKAPGGGLINQFVLPSQSLHDLTPQQLQGEIDAYDGGVAYVDSEMAQLFGRLKTRGLSENTLVVITSDHGEELGDHGLLGHGRSLYRQELLVPLIFWWPGHIPAAVRLGMPVTNVALPATIMDLLRLGEQNQFPGPSLSKLWETPAQPPDWPDPLAELGKMPYTPDRKLPIDYGGMKSLITFQWQYIKNDNFGEELYDWKDDPQELHDQVDTSKGQTLGRDFLAHLRKLLGYSFGKEDVAGQAPTGEPHVAGPSPPPASRRLH